MNNRNATPNPTMTTRVEPVAAGCCSARATCAMSASSVPVSLAGECDDRRLSACLRRNLQFGFDLLNQFTKTVFEYVFVLVGGSANPELEVAARVAHWHGPQPHVNEVENQSQAKPHDDHAGPDSPLAGLV